MVATGCVLVILRCLLKISLVYVQIEVAYCTACSRQQIAVQDEDRTLSRDWYAPPEWPVLTFLQGPQSHNQPEITKLKELAS